MITVSKLYKSFGNNIILDGFDFKITKGQSLVVIGESGAGKSVLLKCILGLEVPDRGEITVDGLPANPPQFLDRFGMLFQGAALFDSLAVWENVAFRLIQSGMSRAQAKDIAIQKLARVGLSAHVADQYPAELSGGMQKRAGLARAIAADPDIIFFDEPTTGLDPIRAGRINALIREIVDEIGATTITITHDMTSVHAIADQVLMLKDGKVHWTGTPSDIAKSRDPYLKQFVSGAIE